MDLHQIWYITSISYNENEVKKILYRPRYEDMSGETRGKCLRIFLNGMERLKPYHRRRTIQQRKFQFDPDVLRIKGPAFIDGHWQSEKYFFSNVSTIKQELSSTRESGVFVMKRAGTRPFYQGPVYRR